MGQGALSKPVVQWWLSLNSSRLGSSWCRRCRFRHGRIFLTLGTGGRGRRRRRRRRRFRRRGSWLRHGPSRQTLPRSELDRARRVPSGISRKTF